jgi:hypothetical protein
LAPIKKSVKDVWRRYDASLKGLAMLRAEKISKSEGKERKALLLAWAGQAFEGYGL